MISFVFELLSAFFCFLFYSISHFISIDRFIFRRAFCCLFLFMILIESILNSKFFSLNFRQRIQNDKILVAIEWCTVQLYSPIQPNWFNLMIYFLIGKKQTNISKFVRGKNHQFLWNQHFLHRHFHCTIWNEKKR